MCFSLAEAFVGIFAANIPSLRRPLERVFRAITGRTINTITSINRHMHDSKHSNNDMEMSPDLKLANHGADLNYHSTVYAKPHNQLGASDEQLTALPNACYVRHEFEVRRALNGDKR